MMALQHARVPGDCAAWIEREMQNRQIRYWLALAEKAHPKRVLAR